MKELSGSFRVSAYQRIRFTNIVQPQSVFLSRQSLLLYKKERANIMTGFGVVIEKDDDGYYAHIPAVHGCYAQG